MTQTKRVAKDLVVIARIAWKHENKVCYLVRASKSLKANSYTPLDGGAVEYNGQTYQTTERDGRLYLIYQVWFLDNRCTSCTCPAVGDCYHRHDCITLESKRIQAEDSTAITPQHIETLTQDGELYLLASLKTLPRATQTVQNNLTSGQPVTDLSMKGTLSSNAQRQTTIMRPMNSIEAGLPPFLRGR